MRKLHIVNHELMPDKMICDFNIMKDGCYSYLMESKEDTFFYEIIIKPFMYGKEVTFINHEEEVKLEDSETLENLIFTHAEYFMIRLCDLNLNEIERLYERTKEVPLYYLN